MLPDDKVHDGKFLDDTARAELARRTRELTAGLRSEVVLVFPVLAGAVLSPSMVAAGDAFSVRLTPADALRPLLERRATGGVLVHTHLDESCPSSHDAAVTRRCVAAFAIVGVDLLGHLVVTQQRWFEVMRPPPLSQAS